MQWRPKSHCCRNDCMRLRFYLFPLFDFHRNCEISRAETSRISHRINSRVAQNLVFISSSSFGLPKSHIPTPCLPHMNGVSCFATMAIRQIFLETSVIFRNIYLSTAEVCVALNKGEFYFHSEKVSRWARPRYTFLCSEVFNDRFNAKIQLANAK